MTILEKISQRQELFPEYLKEFIQTRTYQLTNQHLKHTLAYPTSRSFGSWLSAKGYECYFQRVSWESPQ